MNRITQDAYMRQRMVKYTPKPYQKADYPGQKVQLDVKYVPTECLDKRLHELGEKFYQYTVIDEFSRLPYRQMYNEHSTESSKQFLIEAVAFYKKHGITIEWAQTDNGTEWTKAFVAANPDDKTSFELQAEYFGIRLTRIRPYTPRHNGKVERQHRKDNQRFYRKLRVSSLEEGMQKLAAYGKRSEHYPISTLGYRSPLEVLAEYRIKSSQAALALVC